MKQENIEEESIMDFLNNMDKDYREGLIMFFVLIGEGKMIWNAGGMGRGGVIIIL